MYNNFQNKYALALIKNKLKNFKLLLNKHVKN